MSYPARARGYSYDPSLRVKNLEVRKFQAQALSVTQWGSQNWNLGG